MAYVNAQLSSLLCYFAIGLAAAASEQTPLYTVVTEWLNETQGEVTQSLTTPLAYTTPLTGSCRYWQGHTDIRTYHLTTCGYCYGYMFQTAELEPYNHFLVSVNGTVFPHMTFIQPDRHNDTIVEGICKTIKSLGSCDSWLDCCVAAEECCQTQLEEDHDETSGKGSKDLGPDGTYCPRTWDGYACWDHQPRGTVERQSCPEYVPFTMPMEDAYKTCWDNGTWYEKTPGKEWTDFTTCYNFDKITVVIYVKLACDALSLLALIPSLGIFLAYRQLRNQNRIRLHMNLFVSFIAYALINIIWEVCVVHQKITSETGESVMGSNSGWCKLLYVLTRYTSTTNYLWMFCEGLYLHRLIVKAFQPPKKLYLFYAVGWGFPWIPIGAYSIIRIFIGNESCWVHQIGGYEWIIYTPNLIALAANLAFLIDILRILLTQLQSHPNEPSNYRRALKATFVLVPLFGLQLFLIIYRPPLTSNGGHIYEIISAIIVNTQGFFVALIFCLINGEVHGNLRRTLNRYGLLKATSGRAAKTGYTGATQTSDVFTRESPTSSFRTTDYTNSGNLQNKNYIAMKPVGNSNGHFS